MLSLFPVVCSNFGAISFNAEVNATDVRTLISAALPGVVANEHNTSPAAATARRFVNDAWFMHPLP
jgi:hypothetical protein